MSKPIKGKVALVLSEYEVALNIGSDSGVEKGMKFTIHSSPITILDPDTSKEIGQVTIEVDRVEVFEVEKGYSRAETYTKSASINILPYPTLFKSPSRKKLSLSSGVLADFEGTIKVGSIVVQIVDE